MSGNQTAVLSYRNHLIGPGEFASADFDHVAKLGEIQLAENARAEGAAEFTWTAPAPVPIQTLALLGHDLPQGTLVEWLDGASLIAAATWRPMERGGHPDHLVRLLPEAVTLDELTCRITPPGSEQYAIGAGWAGEDLRIHINRGWSRRHRDNSEIAFADTVPWPARRGQVVGTPVRWDRVHESDAIGIAKLGAAVPVPETWDTDNTTLNGGWHEVGGANGTLLEKLSFLSTAVDWYQVTIELEQDAGNAGIVAVHIGAGNSQALAPGRNVIEGRATDGDPATTLRIATATATNFSGRFRIHSIHQVDRPPGMPHLDGIFREVGGHKPVLMLPRTFSHQWVHSTAIYGFLVNTTGPAHVRGKFYRADGEVEEIG